jgi:hypothetical protein
VGNLDISHLIFGEPLEVLVSSASKCWQIG